MRKVIDGKVYDTDTATELCELPCNAYKGDFAWHDTRLYRSPRGRYFIAGEGNAASMWAHRYGNGRGGGSGLRVISTIEAREYMEEAGCSPEEMIAAGFAVEEG